MGVFPGGGGGGGSLCFFYVQKPAQALQDMKDWLASNYSTDKTQRVNHTLSKT